METAPESPVSPSPLAGKRVLIGITKSNWGGAQAYSVMVAKAAKEAGAHVSVMAGGATVRGSDSGKMFESLEELGIQTLLLSSIQRNYGFGSEWQALKELVRVIRQEKPDILHLNSSKMGALGAIAGRIAGAKRIIFTAHGWPYLEQRPLWWKALAWIGSWPIVVFSSKIITVSDYDLRTAPVLLLRDKLVHIDNGIEPFPLKSREEARAELAHRNHDLAKYSQWLFMTAELHPNKGIAVAVRAIAELAPRHPDLALVICGEGQDRDFLTELALQLGVASRVFLLGFVENAREYLSAADIFLMPSRKEGMPLAVLEAGMASLPVIATKVGGIPDIIDDKKTGLFMPRSNTHVLAKAIAYLLNDPEEASKMGDLLHQKIRTDFSAEDMIEKTLALYTA